MFVQGFLSAKALSDEIAANLPAYPVDERFYHPQCVTDGGDNLKFVVPDLLNLACHLDLYALEARTEELDGIIVPAHVDKQSASLLSVLGCVPDDLKTGCLEISRACPEELRLGLSRKYLLLESSDAHCLEDMCASDFYLELERNDIEGLFEILKNPVL